MIFLCKMLLSKASLAELHEVLLGDAHLIISLQSNIN